MWNLVRRSRAFVAPDLYAVCAMVSMALGVAMLGAVEPLISKFLFDELAGSPSLRLLALAVGALFAVEIARAVIGGWMSVVMWRIRLRTDLRLRETLIGKLCALPVAYHRDQRVGSLVTRVNQSITSFLNTFIELSANTLPAFVFLTLSLVAMFKLDPRLSAVVLVFLPMPTIIGAWAAREQAHRERLLMEKWSTLYGRLHETLAGILTVKGFAREQAELDEFMQGSVEGNEVVRAGVSRDTLTTGARNFAATLARIAAIGFGAYYVARGEMTVGTLVAFLGYIGGLFGPVQGLTGAYQTMRRGVVALEVIYEILDTDDGISDRPNAREAPSFRGFVHFRDVTFGYEEGAPVLENIDLRARPGETIALVGPSGSGKTTLVSLLQRQYDVTSGTILVDGMDVRAMKVASLRRQIGVVFQDVHLFNDTIHANIAYGRPGATRQAVIEAARAANAHTFIRALPDGYDTVLGENGSRLSGGQKQRLAIARALLIDPPILILDEATSALDAESEAVVQEALERLSRGRTTFIIAHRLATVTRADRIVVLRDGRIEAVGTHEQLMDQDGYYAHLVGLQADGFLATDPMGPAVAA